MKILETERLILRKVSEEDALELYKNVYSDPLVYKYQKSLPRITTLEEIKKLVLEWIDKYEKDYYSWVICLKKDSTIIGRIDVDQFPNNKNKYSLKYMIGSDFWSKSYTSEAAKEVINYMLNIVGVDKIIGECHESNLASEQVMKKIGMEYIGVDEKKVLDKMILMKYYKIVNKNKV